MTSEKRDYKQAVSGFAVFIWGLGAIFYAYEFALRTSMNAISQDMIHTLGFNASEISIIASVFYWFYVIAQIPAGISVDKYGPRRVLIFTTFLCAIGTVIFTFSNHFLFLCIGRALMGLGGGFAFVSTLKIASYWLPDRWFPLFAGLTQFMGYMGAAFSGIPLVSLMKVHQWRSIFIFAAAFGVVLFLVNLFSSIGSTAHKATEEERSTFSDTIVNLLKISKNPQVLLNGLYCTFVMGATAVFADLWGIDFLFKVKDIPVTTAATACSIVFIGVAVLSPFWGVIASLLRSSRIPLIWSAILSVITTILLLYVNIPVWGIFLVCFLFGGFQAAHVLNFTILKDVVDSKYLGSAIAFVNMFTVAGGALFQPLAGLIIDTSHRVNAPAAIKGYNGLDFMIGLAIIPVVQFLAFLIAMALKEKKEA
jgi:MFS family permease